MRIATVSEKFQICIPKQIRDQLHIKAGQQYIFVLKGNCLELIPKKHINDFLGVLAGTEIVFSRDRSDLE